MRRSWSKHSLQLSRSRDKLAMSHASDTPSQQSHKIIQKNKKANDNLTDELSTGSGAPLTPAQKS